MCMSGVRWKSSVQIVDFNKAATCGQILYELKNGQYHPDPLRPFYLSQRGKTRFIQQVALKDRIVQKCLVIYCLRPLLQPTLLYTNSASRKGKGTDFALTRLRQDIIEAKKEFGNKCGIIKGDLHNYFAMIPHDKLAKKIKRYIKDKKLFALTMEFVNQFQGDTSLGLGSEISQILAIFYLSSFDHTLKEKYSCFKVGRYNDDFYILDDIDKLKIIYNDIPDLLKLEQLTINQKKTKIYKLSNNTHFVFLKKTFFLTDNDKIITKPCKKIITRKKHHLKKLKQLYQHDIISLQYIQDDVNQWIIYSDKYEFGENASSIVLNYYNNIMKKHIQTNRDKDKLIAKLKRRNKIDADRIDKLEKELIYTMTDEKIIKSIKQLSDRINQMDIRNSKFYDAAHANSTSDITVNQSVLAELEIKIANIENKLGIPDDTESSTES